MTAKKPSSARASPSLVGTSLRGPLFNLGLDDSSEDDTFTTANRTEAVEHPLEFSANADSEDSRQASRSPSADDHMPNMSTPGEHRPVKSLGVPRLASYGGAGSSSASSDVEYASRPSSRPTSSYQGGRHPPFLSRNARSTRFASEASLGTGLEGRRDGQDDGASGPSWRATAQGATPLDRTIDAIGMGYYQYFVLILTGCGWAADNMWLQGVAITLPRIQDEWAIRDQWIGLVSSSTFAGMMVGALAWGSYADSFGRVNAFNITLLITSVFGLLSAFAPNFPLLCLCLFLLGTGVGGSMPTDGTIFLEALPKRYHYLVTALSVFFAAGSVVSSVLGLMLVPSASCGNPASCQPEHNKGWRYLMGGLGILTFLFVIARLLFFTLLESPKFLVSAGKHEEARDVLQRIAAFNGNPKKVRLADVSDNGQRAHDDTERHRHKSGRPDKGRPAPEDDEEDSTDAPETQRLMPRSSEEGEHFRTSAYRDSYRHSTIIHEIHPDEEEVRPQDRSYVPAKLRPSVQKAVARYSELFTPQWKKTTTLVWLIWTLFTLAYTMVNVFLPKYLESRTGAHVNVGARSEDRREAIAGVMREFVFYSLASLPGSLLGAWLIETPLGRIKSMALSTACLSVSLLAFALLSSTALLVIMSSCAISLFASIAYAVIYSYSPEVFATSIRGTACGTASALSRFAGIIAPVLAGALMQMGGLNLPLYVGFALFGITVWLELMLPIETRGRSSETDGNEA